MIFKKQKAVIIDSPEGFKAIMDKAIEAETNPVVQDFGNSCIFYGKIFSFRLSPKDISNHYVYEIENKKPVNRSFLKVYEVIGSSGWKGSPMPNVTKEISPVGLAAGTVQLSVDVTRCLYKSTKDTYKTSY